MKLPKCFLLFNIFKIKLKFIRRELYNKKLSVKTFKWIFDQRQYIGKPTVSATNLWKTLLQEFLYFFKTKTSRILLFQEQKLQDFYYCKKLLTGNSLKCDFVVLRLIILRKNTRLLQDTIFKNFLGWVSAFYHNNLI